MMGSLLLAFSGASGVAGCDLGAGGGERTGCTAEALEQCAPQSVEGIDVFDGQGTIDWPAVARGGVAFAMIKATQGTYDTQATFAANWSGARRAGVARGAYHFFDPTEDGAAQAQRFLAAVGPLSPGDLPPMLDLECPDGDADCLGTGARAPETAPATAIAQRMWDWIHAVEGATGARPILYTFGSYFASSGIDTTGLGAYPLFLAQPVRSAEDACFSVPAPWSRAAMWQYSWSGAVPGIDVPVDRDRFLGTQAALQALAVNEVGPIAAGSDAGPPDSGDPDAPGPSIGAIAVAEGPESGAGPGPPGCF